jgi:hypothetical protein
MSNKRYYFTNFRKVNEENVKERFQRHFFKWIFRESDKVWSNGNLLDKNKKFSYLLADFNISPKPKKIECSALNDGIKLTEGMFIEIELSKVKEIISDTKGSEENYLIHERAKIYLNYLQNRLKNIDSPNVNTPTANVVALFCNLINKIKLHEKLEDESAEMYCKKICGEYNLKYTDKVRQNYYSHWTQRNIKSLKSSLLPLIDKDTRKRISQYLDNNHTTKQNLYC